MQNENNNFKSEYPLAYFFLQQHNYFKFINQWVSLLYEDNPFRNFLFHLGLYFEVQYAKIQTFYLYLSSLASFYLNTKFRYFSTWYDNDNAYSITTKKQSNEKKVKIILLISIAILLLSMLYIFIFRQTFYFKYFKAKTIITHNLFKETKKSSGIIN